MNGALFLASLLLLAPLMPALAARTIAVMTGRQGIPLLQPYRLKHLTLRNRLMSTAHEPAYTVEGMPADRYAAYGDRIGVMHDTERGDAPPTPHSWDTPEMATLCKPGGNGRVPRQRRHCGWCAALCQRHR